MTTLDAQTSFSQPFRNVLPPLSLVRVTLQPRPHKDNLATVTINDAVECWPYGGMFHVRRVRAPDGSAEVICWPHERIEKVSIVTPAPPTE